MKKFEITFYDYWNPRTRIKASVVAKNERQAKANILLALQQTEIGTAAVITKIKEV